MLKKPINTVFFAPFSLFGNGWTQTETPFVFTPDWIVRYMVENSVGRLWIEHLRALDETVDESALAANFGWKYYLPETKQEPEVETELNKVRKERASMKPEQITMIDPCMGSGHILVYAFDVLMQIYANAGYGQRDAAKSILENNLFGLDIDERAYQMAYFAVMMKARAYNRRILNGENKCRVYAISESNGITDVALGDMGANLSREDYKKALREIKNLIIEFKDAKEYGSILNIKKRDWDLLRRFAEPNTKVGQLTLDINGAGVAAERLREIINIAEVLANQYWVSFTNPPYLGSGQMSSKLIEFVRDKYPNSKADLFGPMIEQSMKFCRKTGFVSMITQQTWMFLPSFEVLRELILKGKIVNLLQLGAHAFDEIGGEVVQTASFVWENSTPSGYRGLYARLVNGKSEVEKKKLFTDKKNLYTTDQDSFSGLPGTPIAYWVEKNILEDFKYPPIIRFCSPRVGCQTSDNNRFLRLWFEVSISKIGFGVESEEEADMLSAKWFPFNKGGNFRKWYGNRDYVVNWENKGFEVKDYARSMYGNDTRTVKNQPYYFKRCFSWSKIFSGSASFRFYETGFIFSDAGLGVFTDDDDMLLYLGGFLNSPVSQNLIKLLSPTLNLTSGIIEKMPLIVCEDNEKHKIISMVKECIRIEREDFNESELSWEFSGSRFKQYHRLDKMTEMLIEISSKRRQSLLELENNINSIFLRLYGQKENESVASENITVTEFNINNIIRNVLSYAVGCMFGRYSLDTDGLAYAGGDWEGSKYSTFLPDEDNIIPITDEEYLEDDIVSRFCTWLKIMYGESSLEENLDFIARALGNKGSSSRDVIRNYFLKEFFKDHCQSYSVNGSGKRPIYWLFDSGKENGFKAMIYLHRYNADTIGNIRIDYLHRIQRIYESEISRMEDMIDHSMSAREVAQATKRREKLHKQIKECREYDEKLAHLALSRIKLNLDDGVKINYRKLQTANDEKYYGVLADAKSIMANDKQWKQYKEGKW